MESEDEENEDFDHESYSAGWAQGMRDALDLARAEELLPGVVLEPQAVLVIKTLRAKLRGEINKGDTT